MATRSTTTTRCPASAAASPAAGARSFVLNYVTKGGRERRITIGSCADWTHDRCARRGQAAAPDRRPGRRPAGRHRRRAGGAHRGRAGRPVRAGASAAQACRARRSDYRHMLRDLHPASTRAPEGGRRHLQRHRRAPPQDHQERQPVRGQPRRGGAEQDVQLGRSDGTCARATRPRGSSAIVEQHRRRYLSATSWRGWWQGAGRAPGPAGGRHHPAAAAHWRTHGRSAGDALGRRRPHGRASGRSRQAPPSRRAHHECATERTCAAIAERDSRAAGRQASQRRSANSSSLAPARAGTSSTSRERGGSSAAPRRSTACASTICGTRSLARRSPAARRCRWSVRCWGMPRRPRPPATRTCSPTRRRPRSSASAP